MSENVKVSISPVIDSGGYDFSQDWFRYGPNLWPSLKQFIPSEHDRAFLEIGSFEGRSTVWTMENMMQPGDSLLCVDTWEGGEEHSSLNMDLVRRRFVSNIERAKDRCPGLNVVVENSPSWLSLACAIGEETEFDFIYIDGSHQAPDVLRDCVMAWTTLKTGGVMVLDDYVWGDPRMPLHRPKMAIDAFMNIYAADIVILHMGYQVAIKKERVK